MRYKTQNDIDFEIFREYSERIQDLEPEEVLQETISTFFPKSKTPYKDVVDFHEALKTKGLFEYKIDLEFKHAGRFIDADTFLIRDDLIELAKLLIKKRHIFQKVRLSLGVVNHITEKFLEFAAPIKELHEWIYNPPTILTDKPSQQNSIASMYMTDFVNHYGPYIEMVYLICNGKMMQKDEVTNMSLDEFLFLGEYLLRKKRIESI